MACRQAAIPCSATSARSVLSVATSARSKQARANCQAASVSRGSFWYRACARRKFFLTWATRFVSVARWGFAERLVCAAASSGSIKKKASATPTTPIDLPRFRPLRRVGHRPEPGLNTGTGSATAADRLGGVRPSSGAAMSERERATMESDASEQPVLAAPEDGRTPITLYSAVADQVPNTAKLGVAKGIG